MRRHSLAIVSILCATLASSAVPAAARTLKECNAAFAADKAEIKLSGRSKAAYVAACRAETAPPPGTPAAPPPPVDPMAPKPIMRP
jgi:hypothetical protein